MDAGHRQALAERKRRTRWCWCRDAAGIGRDRYRRQPIERAFQRPPSSLPERMYRQAQADRSVGSTWARWCGRQESDTC
jgi:hypothetical protein